ncbi:MAG: hypothetical protein J6N45_08545 [Alphaproteobacteria bacterium]|nr:hypothetical protein [Alphaproteobacteria bacterium]
MKNKILTALLFLPIILLAGSMLYYEKMTHFDRVEIAVEGYDPKDFFSGYYMYLQPNWEKTDCMQFAESICPQEEFESRYNFYINTAQSAELTKAVNAGVVKLVFSYDKGKRPQIVDLLVDGISYISAVKKENQ